MTPLHKKRNEEAQKHWEIREDIFDLHDFEKETIATESFKLGFDAMYAEHERIVKGLVEGLQIVKFLEQKVHWVAPINRDELRALIVKANEALEAYKRECGE